MSEIQRGTFLSNMLLKITSGETLTKLHYTSSGSRPQFFLPYKNTSLKWASKPSSIYKDKPTHVYLFSDIRGVVYGHVTKTFQKSSNMKKFEPWLCFSIILKNRPFDLYCKADQITKWFVGLSAMVKIQNKNAYCLRVGKYLWRRVKMIMVHRILNSVTEDNRKKILRYVIDGQGKNFLGKEN
jgi:hypothetical protein